MQSFYFVIHIGWVIWENLKRDLKCHLNAVFAYLLVFQRKIYCLQETISLLGGMAFMFSPIKVSCVMWFFTADGKDNIVFSLSSVHAKAICYDWESWRLQEEDLQCMRYKFHRNLIPFLLIHIPANTWKWLVLQWLYFGREKLQQIPMNYPFRCTCTISITYILWVIQS